jgi:hypothetical protein
MSLPICIIAVLGLLGFSIGFMLLIVEIHSLTINLWKIGDKLSALIGVLIIDSLLLILLLFVIRAFQQ